MHELLHYFHGAISKHLSEKPNICLDIYGCLTQVRLYSTKVFHEALRVLSQYVYSGFQVVFDEKVGKNLE